MLNNLKTRKIILDYVINYKITDTNIEYNNYQFLQEDNYLSNFKVTIIFEKNDLYNKIIELKKITKKGFTANSYGLNFDLFVETYSEIEITESSTIKMILNCKGKATRSEYSSALLNGTVANTLFETPLKLTITSQTTGTIEVRDMLTSNIYRFKNINSGQLIVVDSYNKTVNLPPQNWEFWKFPITTNYQYRFQVVVGSATIRISYKARVL